MTGLACVLGGLPISALVALFVFLSMRSTHAAKIEDLSQKLVDAQTDKSRDAAIIEDLRGHLKRLRELTRDPHTGRFVRTHTGEAKIRLVPSDDHPATS